MSPAIAVSAVTLALELLLGFAPMVLGPNASFGLNLALAVVTLALLAGLLIGDGSGSFQGAAVWLGAVVLSLGRGGAAYVLVALLIPAVVATPVLVRRWSVPLAVTSFALFAGMVVGQFVFPSG